MKKSNIYFMSDPHYGHKNIVRGISNWTDKSGCRNFDTLDEMNNVIVDNINNTVGQEDILYCLGDWSFGGIDNVLKFRERLNVREIHLVLGNHDHNIESDRDYCQSLFSSVKSLSEIKIEGQRVVLCHYAMRVWNKSHHGSWMLYGHSHGTLPEYGVTTYPYQIDLVTKYFKTMDVGIDTHPEFRPYSFEEIKEIMNKRTILNIDHHNEKTT